MQCNAVDRKKCFKISSSFDSTLTSFPPPLKKIFFRHVVVALQEATSNAQLKQASAKKYIAAQSRIFFGTC
eukprot:scaffold4266_cov139-Skeletonema_menzelii.AAC.14